MRGNINEVAQHGEMLALYAAIEAVAAGESGRSFAELAKTIREFNRDIQRKPKRPLSRDDLQLLSALGCHRDDLNLDLDRIDDLSRQIQQLAREVTSSLHNEDVESQVVVYSKRCADYLRELVARIEGQKFDLDNALANDRNHSLSIEQTCRRHLKTERVNAGGLPGGL